MCKRFVYSLTSGFCAGVDRAIKGLQLAVDTFPNQTIYARHAIVHNSRVVKKFTDQGVVFVEDINKVPDNSIVVLSAHGTPPQVYIRAREKNLFVVDAICPLVLTTHNIVHFRLKQGQSVAMIGERGHQEVNAIMGLKDEFPNLHLISSPEDIDRCKQKVSKLDFFATQTTISTEELDKVDNFNSGLATLLRGAFPNVMGIQEHKGIPHNLCYATSNRQNAVRELAQHSSLSIIIGDITSSNSRRLALVAKSSGNESVLVNDQADIDLNIIDRHDSILITAGASSPPEVIEEIIDYLKAVYRNSTWRSILFTEETEVFPKMVIQKIKP